MRRSSSAARALASVDPLADEALAQIGARLAGHLLEAAHDVGFDALALVVELAARRFEALEPLLALGDGGGARDHARSSAANAISRRATLVLAALQLALELGAPLPAPA